MVAQKGVQLVDHSVVSLGLMSDLTMVVVKVELLATTMVEWLVAWLGFQLVVKSVVLWERLKVEKWAD